MEVFLKTSGISDTADAGMNISLQTSGIPDTADAISAMSQTSLMPYQWCLKQRLYKLGVLIQTMKC
jgi:hypothetical protein